MSGIDINLNFASVYWTHREMFGREFTCEDMVETLGQIAVDDMLETLGRLSCMVEGKAVTDAGRQRQILKRLGLFDDKSINALEGLFEPREGDVARSLFFPQQVLQLSRLAIRHGDRRQRDGFGGGRLRGPFIRCIFGVTDLLGTELERGTESEARTFMLRQLGLMSRQETLYLFSRYYELLVRLWPVVHGGNGRFRPADEFYDFTGLTLEEFFILGFAVYTRFLNHVDREVEPQDFALHPETYFKATKLKPEQWQRFLALLSKTPDELRQSLDDEDERYGLGLHRSHTFDRAPLVRLGEFYVPTSFASLERAVTEGAFWLLADAAEAKGLPREEFTSPFGQVFERFAQESLERMADMENPSPATRRDFLYGPKKARVLSSDLSYLYEREGVFFEVVTGRPSVATFTRGDGVAFREDLRRLVIKKATQLRRCFNDFFLYGILRFDGVFNEKIQTIWPVLVVIEDFPLMPPIYGQVVEQLRRDNWPKLAPPLTLIDADELAALEAMVEKGWTVERALKTWKSQAPGLPFSNWVAASPDFPDGLGHATWHSNSFRELSDSVTRTVFGRSWAEIQAEQVKGEAADDGSG